jgi:cytochrome c biogenesis protein CcmG, thiol:disulfide interchange protein DsbE
MLLWAACATAPQPPGVRHHLSGQEFQLEAFQGHVMLLNFWATWCKSCLVEIPELAKLANQFGDRVIFVAVYYQRESTAGPQVTAWLRVQPEYFSHQVAWGNSALQRLFPHPLLPTTYVIGRGGVVVSKFEGSITSDARLAELRAAIEVGLQQPLPEPAIAR